MKRLLLLTILLLIGSISFSQRLVSSTTLSFVRPQGSIGSFSAINISVNNLNIGQIENGNVFSHSLSITAKSSVTVKATSSIYTREISFDVEPGQSYFFELGFLEQGIFMLAIDQLAFNRHIQNIQSATSTTSTTSTQQGAALVPSQGGSQATFVAPGAKVQEQPTTSQPSVTQTSANQLVTQALKDQKINYEYEKDLDSEAIRQQWLQKGGQITGTSFVGGLSVLYKETESYVLEGAGLNLAYNQNLFNLKIPEYTTGPSSWSSFHFGYGLAGSLNSTSISFESIYVDGFYIGNTYYPGYYIDMDPVQSTSIQLDLNLNIGLTLGLGKFLDRTNWRGAAIELNYRPTYSTFIPEEGDPISNFNFSGFSFDINGSNFTSTMEKLAPKAQLKFSLFILPPVKDMPFFISINLGAIWYSK